MFSSKAPDHLAFLARHLAATAQTDGSDGALARLAAAAPEAYTHDIDRLSALLGDQPVADTTVGLSPYGTLSELLRSGPADPHGLLAGFVEYLQHSRAVYDTFLTGMIGFLWYVGVVGAISVVTTLIYATAVYPQVTSLLRAPPALAAMLFQGGGAPLLVLGMVSVLALAAGGTLLFYRRIQQVKPMPAVPRWVPGAARLCRTYNYGLLINFARLLMENGLAPDAALDRAAQVSGHRQRTDDAPPVAAPVSAYPDHRSMQQLAIARRLGTLETELRAQCDEHLGELSMALLTVRERLSLGLKLVLFVYVGLLVVSMYQPLFQSSSVF